ncbi:hypothetical protein [Microviridae sp.]|nr:hypothetical protein [Microviridae sp.]
MKKYLTLQQASKKISNLCKAIGDLDYGVLGAEPKFVSELLKSGHKFLWISKLTGLLYFGTPRFEGNYLKVIITCHKDKYELELQ